MFIDREDELNSLENFNAEERAQLLILYGRRRMGKTTLLQHFIADKRSIFFIADASDNILDTFSEIASQKFNYVKFSNWDDFFNFLYSISKNERFIVVIDEFQYLYNVFRAWPTVLQRHWEGLKNTKIFLILSGSLILSIYRISLGYGSALYGRKTGEMNIAPLNFINSSEFFNISYAETSKIFMILGGVPRYLEEFTYKTLKENLINRILNKNSYLYNEPLNLLFEEYRDITSYFSVLSSIANGASSFNEISLKSHIAQNKLSKVLNVLERSEIIRKEPPLLTGNKKNHIYYIKDNFFAFWFRFVYPYKSLLELNNIEYVYDKINKDINTYYGHRFEFIARELLLKYSIMPFDIFYLGRSWKKSRSGEVYEFDIVVQDADKIYTGIFEVKYKKLNYNGAKSILINMINNYNEIYPGKKAFFGIIALKIEEKQKLTGEGYYCIDLDDIR